jgi:hypothetical protein
LQLSFQRSSLSNSRKEKASKHNWREECKKVAKNFGNSERMNELEAKIILRCRPAKKLDELWKSFYFKEGYRYDYIAKVCSQLEKIGFLSKRKFRSPVSKKIVVYYVATDNGLNEALQFVNSRIDEKINATTKSKPLTEYVTR